MADAIVKDNGGTRSGFDRRQFTYTIFVPERRSRGDRRSGRDRRQMQQARGNLAVERRGAFVESKLPSAEMTPNVCVL
jgi:hypothetical protein